MILKAAHGGTLMTKPFGFPLGSCARFSVRVSIGLRTVVIHTDLCRVLRAGDAGVREEGYEHPAQAVILQHSSPNRGWSPKATTEVFLEPLLGHGASDAKRCHSIDGHLASLAIDERGGAVAAGGTDGASGKLCGSSTRGALFDRRLRRLTGRYVSTHEPSIY